MAVKIRVVVNKEALKEFIFLPEKIHSQHNNWVPPVYADEWKFYDPLHNKSMQNADTLLLLAYKEERCSGRIMGIINRQYNQEHNESTARFFNFDCYEDPTVAHALINSVENWAKEKGMKKMIGPFGFSDKDPQGLQVEGFEHLPVIATPTNLPYLQKLVEQQGYVKEVDCIVYKLNVPDKIPVLYQRIYDRLIRNKNLRLLEFKSKKELKPWIVPVFRLVNKTYQSIFGFVAMDEEEMYQLADKYLPMLDPEFTKLVLDEKNNPVAFVVASPDISYGIKKAKGKIFPFGFIYILSSAKFTRQLDLFLGAVNESYQNKGITALLGVSLFKSAIKRRMSYIDSHLILETNKPMRAVMERLEATIYKRYRIYHKFFV